MAFSHDDLSRDTKDIEFYTDNENKIESVYLNKAQVLLEALPYIKEDFAKIVVVKIGGAMMENDSIMQSVLDDLILMKYVGMKVVLVHGGGKQITELMEQKKIKVEFVDGLRVTTKDTIDVVKMVLMGSINSKMEYQGMTEILSFAKRRPIKKKAGISTLVLLVKYSM
jgi:hypothetical protein